MAITQADLKLYQAEVNDDSDNGGGRTSGTEIVDGLLNNLFTDKSRLDKTFGRFSARRGDFAVESPNNDEVLGKHLILVRPPEDPGINVVMYAARSAVEKRQAVAERVQRFDTTPGAPLTATALVGNVIPGATQIELVFDGSVANNPWSSRSWWGNSLRSVAITSAERLAPGMLIELRRSDTAYAEAFVVQAVSTAVYDLDVRTSIVTLDRAVRGTFPGTGEGVYDPDAPSLTTVRMMAPGSAARDDTYFYGVTPLVGGALTGATSVSVANALQKICPDELTYADIIGLAPISLPPSNVISIARPGQGVVIHHTGEYTLPDNPAIAGTTYGVGRTNLSYLEVRDQLGVRVTTDKYTPDLAAGEIEMANPLDLTGYVQPLVITHMIESRGVVAYGPSNSGQPLTVSLGTVADLVANSPHTIDAGGIGLLLAVELGPATFSKSTPGLEWTVNEGAGTITFTANNYTSQYGSLNAFAVYQQDENSTVYLDRELTRDFPDDGNSYLSSVYPIGDSRAAAAVLFSESAFTSWSDSQQNGDTTAQFDDQNYPIAVRNDGAVTERWRLNFLGATSFQVIGETLGLLGQYETSDPTVAPVNPRTGQPYFTIDGDAFGSGWIVGNQVRFNTTGEISPVWFLRATMPGDDSVTPTDDVRAMLRADSND